MHFVVTGANGFIGRRFVAHLLERGHRVTAVVRENCGAVPEGAECLTGGFENLAGRPDLLESADAVCHLAWSSIPASSFVDPVGEIDNNLRPTVALLDAMRQSGNGRIIFLSSGGAVYGAPLHPTMTEDHPTNPISPYGASKLAAERFLHCYAQNGELSPVVIRPANPYGPNQGKVGQLGAVWTFVQKILSGQPATIFGDGSIVRDFVHIDDLCRLMTAAAESDAVGTFNCGGGEGVSLIELVRTVEAASGRTLEIEFLPDRPFDPRRIVLDISRARERFGWIPEISLVEGVAQLLPAGKLDGESSE